MDYSPQGLKESDVTEAMAHEHKQGTRSRMLQLRLGAVKSINQEKKKKSNTFGFQKLEEARKGPLLEAVEGLWPYSHLSSSPPKLREN